MAAIKQIRTLVLYLAFLLLSRNNVSCEDSSIIQTVLEYLNSNPNRVYDYIQGQLVDIQYKGGVLEASIDIEANCNGWYPEIPCNSQILTCHSYLGQNNEQPGMYEVLSDVRCSPKFDRQVEEVENVKNVPMSFAEQNSQTGQLDLSHEALPPEQENADFIALNKDTFPCVGCPFDLDKNVEGVSELTTLALKHIESEKTQRHKITSVKRLQEQVVAGVKYILEAEVAQTSCEKNTDLLAECPVDTSVEPFICQVTFFQQPWISKEKRIIKNNCTVAQEFQLSPNENDNSNEISSEKGSDRNNVQTADISNFNQRLADIESQIIGADVIEASKTLKTSAESVPEKKSTVEELNVEPLMQNTKSALRTLYVSMPVVDEAEPKVINYQPQNIQFHPEQDQLHDYLFRDVIPKEEVFKRQVDPKKDSSQEDSKSDENQKSNESKSNSTSSSEEQNKKVDSTTVTNNVVVKRQVKNDPDSSGEDSSNSEEERDEKKRQKRAAYLFPSRRYRRSVGQLEKVPSEEKVIVRDLADFAANTLDNIDDDNHKRVILQILGAKKLKLDGIYYQIILRLGISQCQEHEHHESCREKLFTNLTKICKVQVHVDDDYSNPKVVKSQCQNIKKDENDRNRTNYSRYKRYYPSTDSDIHADKTWYLDTILEYLDSVTEGPYKHKVVQKHPAKQLSTFKKEIDFQVGLTKCLKTEIDNRKNCDLLDDSVPEECKLTIRYKDFEITDFKLVCNGKVYEISEKGLYNRLTPFHPDMQIVPANIDEALKDAIQELSIKWHRILNYTVIKYTTNTRVVLISSEDLERPLRQAPAHVKVEKDKFNCLTLNISIITVTDFFNYYIYKTCKPLQNSEQLMRAAFRTFVDHFGKEYTQEEYYFRLKVFRDNIETIERLNRNEHGSAVYGITNYTDWTKEEFSRRNGYRPDLRNDNELPFVQAPTPKVKLPKEFDWRTKGAVTPVKNQGLCGSCWAFSVTGNVEGQYAIKHGKLLEFSEQELVDCDKVDEGCNGGLMDNAYRVIERLGGLESESDYPYEGSDDTCNFDVNKVEVQLTGAVNISHNETDMAKWLVANGPISIAINANAMQFYMGGVSHPFKALCNPNNLDHGVVIVGYGVHKYALFNKILPYWIVKNSWGESWGEQGYYRVYRGDGTCGVNQTPSSALVA